MAALQKIRSSSWILLLMGFGMFLFILTMVLDSNTISAITNSNRNVGEVYGKSLSAQEFYEMVNEASEVTKLRSGGTLTDEQTDMVRNQVWNDYVQYELIKHECDKLGVLVTDKDVEDALRQGSAQAFQNLPMFMGQTGRFDYTALQAFLKQVQEMKGKQVAPEVAEQIQTIEKLWKYTEKQLRRELLMSKYQSLLMASVTVNPVSAKAQFEARTQSANALVAAFPYGTISDKEVKVEDSDLKDAYKRFKELFRLNSEVRDLKYIDYVVSASPADRKAVEEQVKAIYAKLEAGQDPAVVINASKSQTHFVNLPLAAEAFPADVRSELESMSVGSMKAPYVNDQDNTYNVVKLISKVQAPDSVAYRALPVQAADATAMATRADSVLKALNGGAKFDDLAKKLGGRTDTTWINTAMANPAQLTPENAKFLRTLYDAPLNAYHVIDMEGLKVVLQVVNRKAMKTKYVAAVVKVPIDFSKATYDAAVSNMNRFLAASNDLAAFEKNAPKNGYQVLSADGFSASTGLIGAGGYNPGIRGSKEAVQWAFDKAEEGNVSPLYEVGEANNHLLVVALSKVYKKGYMPYDNKQVKDYLTSIVKSEKKGALAAQKWAGVKSVEAAKAKGALVDTLNNVTFAGASIVPAIGVPEPALIAAITATKKGATTPLVIGTEGAYLAQVTEKGTTVGEKFDVKSEMAMQQRGLLQMMGQSIFGALVQKGNVVDKRYKF